MDDILSYLYKNNDIIIIGITGGSCSGKSTFSKSIQNEFPKESIILQQDNYFWDLSDVEDREEYIRGANFDCPQAFNMELFIDHLKKLRDGKNIHCPIYDFATSTYIGHKYIESKKIVIVDGILLLCIPEILELLDYSIFIDIPDDIRYMRRQSRDIRERGYTHDMVVNQYNNSVRPMYDVWLEPYKERADKIIKQLIV